MSNRHKAIGVLEVLETTIEETKSQLRGLESIKTNLDLTLEAYDRGDIQEEVLSEVLFNTQKAFAKYYRV